MARQTKSSLSARILCMTVLAGALAHTEASVVVYLREALVPARLAAFDASVAREAIPLLSPEQLRAAGGNIPSLWPLEMARELAPLLVLLAAAAGLRRRRGDFTGLFLLGFAVWDILYYAALKLLMGWPASLATWDVLFLIPVPWVAPVWAPLAVAATLLVAALALLKRPDRRITSAGRAGAAIAMLAGTALILASFLMRCRDAVGGVPAAFDWPWFAAGWLLAAAALAWVVSRPLVPRL